MTSVDLDQDEAYERAVLSARSDPALSPVVQASFLEGDDRAALERFRASEHWARIARLLREQGIAPPARVIDFGGGRGLVAGSLATEGFKVVLCEPNLSDVCGQGAATRLREAASLSFDISEGDVAALAGEDFDAAVCRAVLHHVEPLVPVLTSVRASLRPSGKLICSDEPTIRRRSDLDQVRRDHPFVQFGVDENALMVREYVDALTEAGFAAVSVQFPVAWTDYQNLIRPETPRSIAFALYWRYRVRSTLFPFPGEVRAIVAEA
ncbi:MAG TPA: methyltransferase domain-containing protein [Solirubrobacterales bacterium]|nr:methyltransferase domain-containing protein [Solirubrobacterales bacterium]